MSDMLSEQDILDVFLESDEEDCLIIDDNWTQKDQTVSSNLMGNLNNLDLEICFERQKEPSMKCVNVSSKYLVDLSSIFPPANIYETQRGYMVREIGESLNPRYICLECGKHYSALQTLRKHQKLHYEKYIYTCKFCQKKYAVKRELEGHLRSHTGKRPYPYSCPGCRMCFLAHQQPYCT